MRESLRVWLNRSYATAAHSIGLLRDNPDGEAVTVLASHRDPDSPVLAAADVVLPERDTEGSAYVAHALATAVEHEVEVFWPRWQAEAVSAVRERFTAAGVATVVAPAEAIARCEDKALTYGLAAAAGVPVPPHAVVRTAAELADAVAELSAHGPVCAKPTVGVGGDGFRLLRTGPATPEELFGPLQAVAAVADVAAALDAGTAPPLLVMPFLPGPELSVDVLAQDGRLLAALTRVKHDERRRVEIVDDPQVTAVVAAVVEAVGLGSVGNVQLRAGQDGRLWLLEVNARASGGLYQGAAAGWNLPWAAVRLALGRPVELPPLRLPAALVTVPALVPLAAEPAPARAAS